MGKSQLLKQIITHFYPEHPFHPRGSVTTTHLQTFSLQKRVRPSNSFSATITGKLWQSISFDYFNNAADCFITGGLLYCRAMLGDPFWKMTWKHLGSHTDVRSQLSHCFLLLSVLVDDGYSQLPEVYRREDSLAIIFQRLYIPWERIFVLLSKDIFIFCYLASHLWIFPLKNPQLY